MTKYADPEYVEVLIHKMMERTSKSEEEIRPAVIRVIEEAGYVIAIPLGVEMALLSARAGEQVVIENLKRIYDGLPHKSHRQLIEDIRSAQVRVKENAVIAKLRAKGLAV